MGGAFFSGTSDPDYQLGLSMTVAVETGSSWKHRKVESLRLLEGEFGRRRVSLDLTPDGPDLSELGYEDHARLVFLTMLVKAPLRAFDVQDADGSPLPILDAADNGFVAWSMLAARYAVDLGREPSAELLAALHAVVHCEPIEAGRIADALLLGSVDERPEFDPELIEPQTAYLTRDLAANFLLVAVLPEGQDDRRIVKYSTHWRVSVAGAKQGAAERLMLGLGFRRTPLLLDISGASDAATYHFEVHAVPGMLIYGLYLPEGSGTSHHREDHEVGVVGHAVEEYRTPPDAPAELLLMVPRGGVRTVALYTTAFTATTFWLERLLPGAHCALIESNDGAAALLLIIPAAYSLVLSRPSESVLLSHLLAPLRMLTMACIILLLAGAASLVGVLHSPYTDVLWWGGAVATTVSLIVQIRAWFVSVPRDTTW